MHIDIRCLATAICVLTGLCLAPSAGAAGPTAQERQAAQCVAALDVNTQDLARQVKAGKDALRRLLLERLQAGAAFVGDSYLHGNSDEDQARALVDQALDAQRSLSAAELAARQTACAAQGAKLLASGNALQRLAVKRLAKKRMERLLGA